MTTPWSMRFHGELRGKQRPKFDHKNKRAYTPAETRAAESDLKYGMRQLWTGPPLKGPVAIRAVVFVAPPASWSKKRRAEVLRSPAEGKPDLDNVLKLIADAGNGVLWVDDKQIVTLSVHRVYAEEAGLRLTVGPIGMPVLRASSTINCETIVETLDAR